VIKYNNYFINLQRNRTPWSWNSFS